MNRTAVRPSAVLIPLTAIVLSASGCMVTVDSAEFTVRQEKRFEVRGAPDVTLITFDGSMEIRSWDKPGVLVEIEKRGADQAQAEAIEVRAEQAGDVITLEVKKPSAAARNLIGFNVSPSAKIIASVPRKSRIVARSGDGSISVERIEGSVDIDTGDGSVRGYDLAGTIRVHTGDGTVRLEHVDGSVEVDSRDGSANLSGKLAAVKLITGDGTVSVRAEDGSVMSEEWELRTGDGPVRLEVPGDFAANLDASTGDGRVRVEGLAEAAGSTDSEAAAAETSRRELRLAIGGGGKLLRLRSGSGSITVKKL